MWIWYVIAFIVLLIGGIVFHDVTCFRTVTYEIKCDKLKSLGCVALLSDLHDHAFGAHNYKLVRELLEQSPNAILIAGDIFNATNYSKNEHALEFLKELEKTPNASWKNHIYLSFGNHESKILRGSGRSGAKEKLTSFLAETTIHVLNNECCAFDEQIDIAGLSIPKEYYKRGSIYPMPEGGVSEIIGFEVKKPTVLLAHNPEYFEEYAKWGALLTVSGHMHGGIANLPYAGGVISARLHLFPKYDGGIFEKDDKKMVLSRGLSWHSIPVRFLNPGELVILKFQ